MKLYLVRPFTSMGKRVGSHSLQHPIGLCYLAAVARDAGTHSAKHKVRIIDCEVEDVSRGLFGAMLKRDKPHAVGFTAMTPVIEQAAAMAGVVKKLLPQTKNIVGGSHASALPRQTLEEFPAFDAAVAGEGEPKLPALCEQAEGGWGEEPIAGCAVRKGREILDYSKIAVEPVELDTLPMPARDLLKLDLYRGASTPGFPQSAYRATMLFTTRGCTGTCIFCASSRVFGRHLRHRSVQSLIGEITLCMKRFKFRHFTIDDDAFTFDRERVADFCDAVAPLGITWDCDARVDHVDEELLAAMARSGCKKVGYGVESGSQRILDKVSKKIELEQVRRAFALTRGAGILSCGFFMVGQHPDENPDDVMLTRRLIREIRPDLITVAVATPFPGTMLRKLMKREGLLPEVSWSQYSQAFTARPFSRTHALSADDLLRLRGALLRGFYLRPSYILRRLARLRSLSELKYWVGAGVQFLQYLTASKKKAAAPGGWESRQ